MAPVAWTFETHIAAPPAAVHAWMADFREDDHNRPAFLRGAGWPEGKPARATRRVVSTRGNVVHLEDEWGRRTFHVTATVDDKAHTVRLTGEHGYDSLWQALPDGAGTLLRVEGRMAPPGLFGLLLPLFAKKFVKEMEQDFNGHAADARDALGAAP